MGLNPVSFRSLFQQNLLPSLSGVIDIPFFIPKRVSILMTEYEVYIAAAKAKVMLKRQFPYDSNSVKSLWADAEFIQEFNALSDIFKSNNLDEIKEKFKSRCSERENLNNKSFLSFSSNPESRANRLYYQLALILFNPETLADLIPILLPSITSYLYFDFEENSGVRRFNRCTTTTLHENNGLPDSVCSPILKGRPVADSSFFKQLVIANSCVIDLSLYASQTLNSQKQIYELLQNYDPVVHSSVYRHNAAWQAVENACQNRTDTLPTLPIDCKKEDSDQIKSPKIIPHAVSNLITVPTRDHLVNLITFLHPESYGSAFSKGVESGLWSQVWLLAIRNRIPGVSFNDLLEKAAQYRGVVASHFYYYPMRNKPVYRLFTPSDLMLLGVVSDLPIFLNCLPRDFESLKSLINAVCLPDQKKELLKGTIYQESGLKITVFNWFNSRGWNESNLRTIQTLFDEWGLNKGEVLEIIERYPIPFEKIEIQEVNSFLVFLRRYYTPQGLVDHFVREGQSIIDNNLVDFIINFFVYLTDEERSLFFDSPLFFQFTISNTFSSKLVERALDLHNLVDPQYIDNPNTKFDLVRFIEGFLEENCLNRANQTIEQKNRILDKMIALFNRLSDFPLNVQFSCFCNGGFYTIHTTRSILPDSVDRLLESPFFSNGKLAEFFQMENMYGITPFHSIFYLKTIGDRLEAAIEEVRLCLSIEQRREVLVKRNDENATILQSALSHPEVNDAVINPLFEEVHALFLPRESFQTEGPLTYKRHPLLHSARLCELFLFCSKEEEVNRLLHLQGHPDSSYTTTLRRIECYYERSVHEDDPPERQYRDITETWEVTGNTILHKLIYKKSHPENLARIKDLYDQFGGSEQEMKQLIQKKNSDGLNIISVLCDSYYVEGIPFVESLVSTHLNIREIILFLKQQDNKGLTFFHRLALKDNLNIDNQTQFRNFCEALLTLLRRWGLTDDHIKELLQGVKRFHNQDFIDVFSDLLPSEKSCLLS